MKTQITMRSFYLEGEIEDGVLTVLKSEGDMSIEGYYTTAEAAEFLGVSAARIRQLIGDHTLSSRKIGNTWLIPVSEVESYKQNRPKAGWPKGKNRKTNED